MELGCVGTCERISRPLPPDRYWQCVCGRLRAAAVVRLSSEQFAQREHPVPSVGPADSLPLVHAAHTRPRAHRCARSGLDQVVDAIALLVMGGEQQHVLCQQQRGGHCGKREGAVSAGSEWGPGGGGSRVRALRLSIRGGPGSLWVPRTANTNKGVLAGHARESHGHKRGS